MAFEMPQLRPCHWSAMGSTNPRLFCCMQGPTTLAISSTFWGCCIFQIAHS